LSYTPTEWQDRIVEKPRTYHVQNNPDGTITLIPAPGTVVQEGTPVNAANLNKLEQGLVAHLADIASKTKFGHVKLSSAVDSTSEDLAATPKAVKTAYDKANEKPFVVGTYTGNGSSSRTISLGFRPSAVYVAAKDGGTFSYSSKYRGGLALGSYPVMVGSTVEVLSITSSGFTVYYDKTNDVYTNYSSASYNPFRYIAFK
jgi:hypothetical protein